MESLRHGIATPIARTDGVANPGAMPVPFSMIQAALAASFVLIWLLIGGTMLADCLAAARRRRVAAGPDADLEQAGARGMDSPRRLTGPHRTRVAIHARGQAVLTSGR